MGEDPILGLNNLIGAIKFCCIRCRKDIATLTDIATARLCDQTTRVFRKSACDPEEMTFRGGFNADHHFSTNVSWKNEPWYNEMNANSRNQRYQNAYGNYRGGYSPIPPGPPALMDFRPPPPPFGPNGPPPPPLPWGKVPETFSKGIKHLLRCGIPKSSVKSLPKGLLNMFELEYCGLCGQHFENFALSRMHYLSKNHQKNQKKWVLQMLDQPLLKPLESPLKSREHFCELCDVVITSKIHAESHYAGRSHRAIVEGRKGPKNPILLQTGMERRVNKLIRREKRCLSKVFLDKDEAAKESSEPKPIQSELYCEICKTCVTCSEQMTAHLNGKKHLTKEKQYILKTMSGDYIGDVVTEAKEQDKADEIMEEPSEHIRNEEDWETWDE